MLNLPNCFARATCDRFVESMCCRPAQPISASSESSSRVAVFQCTAAHTRKTQVILTDSSAGELDRSEEHTSELQSRGHLVCRLLLEKKKKIQYLIEIKSANTHKQQTY